MKTLLKMKHHSISSSDLSYLSPNYDIKNIQMWGLQIINQRFKLQVALIYLASIPSNTLSKC